tara:strand:- start:447 stop:773 length:327 start_codon:yes stop_codon:yes gene_type:complete
MGDQTLSLLITELIASQKETNESIKETNKAVNHLSSSVDKLITDNKVREEKDKHQDEKNTAFADYIKSSSSVLGRASVFLATWDKVKIPLIVVFIIAVMTALNFNFSG